MEDRALHKGADDIAARFNSTSWDDYAAGVLTSLPDGAMQITVATGRDTWNALVNCAGRERANDLAAMRIPDDWRTLETLDGVILWRPIYSPEAEIVGYLFKR